MSIVDTRDVDWYLLISRLEVEAAYCDITVDLLDSASKQSIPRDWLPIAFEGHEEPLPIRSVDNRRGFDSSDQYVDGWIALIREELYANPAVEDIFVTIEGNDVDVWVVIPERDLVTLKQIVEKEGTLLNTLVSGKSPPFLIDFHAIYRCGRNVEELAPTEAIRLPKQV